MAWDLEHTSLVVILNHNKAQWLIKTYTNIWSDQKNNVLNLESLANYKCFKLVINLTSYFTIMNFYL